MVLHPEDGERNRLSRPARAVGTRSSRFHTTTSRTRAFSVSLAGCAEVKDKQNTDVMGGEKSANALPWQREEMTKRRISHISRLTGCSRGKKCSFCLDLDREGCDSAVARSLCLRVHQVEGRSGLVLSIMEFGRTRGKKTGPISSGIHEPRKRPSLGCHLGDAFTVQLGSQGGAGRGLWPFRARRLAG